MPPQKEKKQRDPLEIVFEKVEKQIASYAEELSRLRTAQESTARSVESTTRTLQAAIQNLIKERNMQAEALERLEKQKVSLIEEIGRLNTERAELAAQTEAARQSVYRAQEEKQKIDEEMSLALEQLRERKSRAAQAEEEALAARLELERIEGFLSIKKENLARLEKEERELQNVVAELKEELEKLKQKGRPLKPYQFPAKGLPRLALQSRKYGTILTELDYRAMKRYHEAGGGDLATIVQTAVRNTVPNEFYDMALDEIRSEIRQLVLEVEDQEDE